MAYQKSTATSFNDALTQLAAWLVGRGWTLDASLADGAGWRTHLHKGGWYVHLKTSAAGVAIPWDNGNLWPSVPALWVYLSQNFNGSGSNYKTSTTGAPIQVGQTSVIGDGIWLNDGAQTALHFFDDGNDNITVIVERTTSVWGALGFGLNIIKRGGAWTGGPYLFGQVCQYYNGNPPTTENCRAPFSNGAGSYNLGGSTGFVRANVDGFTGWVCFNSGDNNASHGGTGRAGFSSWNQNSNANAILCENVTVNLINSQAIIMPINLFVARDAGGVSLFAAVPNIFICGAAPGTYAGGSSYFIGADEYVLFPNLAVKKVP